MNTLTKCGSLATLLIAAFSCETQDNTQWTKVDDSPRYVDLGRAQSHGRTSSGATVGLFSAEYLTSGESAEVGRTIYFRDLGNKQLTADFVPGFSLDGTDNVSYYIDQNRPSNDLSVATTSNAIARAMQTWDNVTCSDLGMFRVPSDASVQTGFVAALLGYPGSFDYSADVVHAGWLPGQFFDMLAPQGSTFILGVTFTITFTDDNGNPTDIDNNGKADVAWRETYYNDAFLWRDRNHYDVETIALHESGHALSQAHFGTAFVDNGGGKLHFSPRAVMNAAYSGIQTQIGETDNAGHCSNWASWPGN